MPLFLQRNETIFAHNSWHLLIFSFSVLRCISNYFSVKAQWNFILLSFLNMNVCVDESKCDLEEYLLENLYCGFLRYCYAVCMCVLVHPHAYVWLPCIACVYVCDCVCWCVATSTVSVDLYVQYMGVCMQGRAENVCEAGDFRWKYQK